MKSATVRLKIRVRLADGSRPFLDPVFSTNHKLKPLYAIFNGKPEYHPEGSYFLRFAPPGGKRVWEPVGPDAQLALHKYMQREKTLEAKAVGVAIAEEAKVCKTPLAEAFVEYLGEVEVGKSVRTHAAYGVALRRFGEVVRKRFLEDVDPKDVLAFIGALRAVGLSLRTQANRAAAYFSKRRCCEPRSIDTMHFQNSLKRLEHCSVALNFFDACPRGAFRRRTL